MLLLWLTPWAEVHYMWHRCSKTNKNPRIKRQNNRKYFTQRSLFFSVSTIFYSTACTVVEIYLGERPYTLLSFYGERGGEMPLPVQIIWGNVIAYLYPPLCHLRHRVVFTEWPRLRHNIEVHASSIWKYTEFAFYQHHHFILWLTMTFRHVAYMALSLLLNKPVKKLNDGLF